MSRRLKTQLIANYASLVILGASGFAINFLITTTLGTSALGIFNQGFAVYLVASQLAVGGVHQSALRSIAAEAPGRRRAELLLSALIPAAALGAFTGLITFSSRNFIGRLVESPEVGESLIYVAPALVLFACNKTLLAAINAVDRLVMYAFLQTSRYAVLLGVLGVFTFANSRAATLTAALLIAETVVLVLSLAGALRAIGFAAPAGLMADVRSHLGFGMRGFLSGVFLELNTRIDVLLLGIFLEDRAVGLYTLAATFAEGMFQCLVVVKTVMAPKVAAFLSAKSHNELLRTVRRSWLLLYPGTAFIAVAITAGLALIKAYFPAWGVTDEVVVCFAVLSLGVVAVAGFAPYDNILILAGAPGLFTGYALTTTIVNALSNLALIPMFGLVGAASATAFALATSIGTLSIILKRRLGFSLLTKPS